MWTMSATLVKFHRPSGIVLQNYNRFVFSGGVGSSVMLHPSGAIVAQHVGNRISADIELASDPA
ncbi:hypothetical protein N183_32700 [Sinorhizobium sp. Sb3]|nr:hypothetical protein N183_32700 [Sinorhizobium sp. Sb3]